MQKNLLILIALLFSLMGIKLQAQTITASEQTPLGGLVCNSNVQALFSTTGIFNAGNIFTLEVSDENGDFTTPSVTATTTSAPPMLFPITLTIPNSYPSGYGYRLRVRSSNPVVTSATVSTNMPILHPPALRTVTANPSTVLYGESSTIEIANSQNGVIYDFIRLDAPNALYTGNGSTLQFSTGLLTKTIDYFVVARTTSPFCETSFTNPIFTIPTVTVTIYSTQVNGGRYATIQDAINAATAGQTIDIIANRFYDENVIVDKNLTFTSSNATTYLDATLKNIQVNSGVTLTIDGNMGVSQLLDMQGTAQVIVNAGKNFALRSTETGTAMVINGESDPLKTIQGNVIMERFLKPVNDLGGTNGAGYHLFSSPFTNATISQFADDMNLVLNFSFNTAPEPAYVRPFPNFFTYQETNQGVINGTLYTGRYFISNYRVPTNNPLDILQVGKGYQANIATTSISDNVVELNGGLNNGDYLIPLTNSGGAGLIALSQDGYNLVGNPYPSPLDWDKVIGGRNGFTPNAGNSNVADAIYVDVPMTQYEGSFGTYINGTGINGGQRYIAPMQGFFVKCTAPIGTLQLLNSNRPQTYQDARFFKTEKEESTKEGLIQIALKEGDKMDETAIYFQAGATPNFDAKYDAVKIYKMNSQRSSIYSYNQNEILDKEEYFAINGLGSFDEDKTLPLAMNILSDGEYEITLQTMKYFHSKHELYLYDSLTQTFHNLRSEGDYKFVAKKADEVKRFVLLFKTQANQNFFKEEKVIVYPNPTPNEFLYSLKTSREGNYTIRLFDATGRVIFEESKMKEGAFLEGTINLEKQAFGLYLLQISDSKNTITTRIVKE